MKPHTTDTIPCPPDTLVQIDLGDGQPHVGPAGSWNWGPGAGPEGEGRIHSWVPLVPATPDRTQRNASHARPALAARRRRVVAQRAALHAYPVPNYMLAWVNQ